MTRQQQRPTVGQRPGSILPWFAALLFVFLPLAALVVDLSLARLTRRQMQAAVNAAAIEGLRWRDESSDETDLRERVRLIVSATFDDDLGASDTDAMNFGAGPTVDFESGVQLDGSEFRASRLITSDSIGVFKPQGGLQLNLENQIYGDMAAGQWRDTDDHREGPIDLIPSDPELDDPYERKDFKTEQSEEVDPAVDYDPGLPNDAFLVRLRRTRSEFGVTPILDDDNGVSSTGPTVPFLFGRGGTAGTADLWNRRERGTIVRATAIAKANVVVTLGYASETFPVRDHLYWLDYDDLAPVLDSMTAEFASTILRSATQTTHAIGDAIVTGSSPVLLESDVEYFLPVARDIDGNENFRCIGFISANSSVDSMTMIVNRGRIASRSAVPRWVSSLANATLDDFLAAFANGPAEDHRQDFLQAPALVRTIP